MAVAARPVTCNGFRSRTVDLDLDGRGWCLIVTYRDSMGQPINGFDAQIASICRAHGAALATHNLEDFQGTGVDLVDPWRQT